jgi:hypothetical protein
MTMGSEQTSGGGPQDPAACGEHVYQGLRVQILSPRSCRSRPAARPAAPGCVGRADGNRLPCGTATLAALADGTTRPYVSTGGGMIGGGFHQAVAAATRWFFAELEHRLPLLRPDPTTPCPSADSGWSLSRSLSPWVLRPSLEASAARARPAVAGIGLRLGFGRRSPRAWQPALALEPAGCCDIPAESRSGEPRHQWTASWPL